MDEPTGFTILDRIKSRPPLAIKFDCNIHGLCCYCYNTLQCDRAKDKTDPEPPLIEPDDSSEAYALEENLWYAWYDRDAARRRDRWEPIAGKCPKCTQHKFPTDEDGAAVYPTSPGHTNAEGW